MAIQVKRVYDEPAAGDGYRVLVDRLWPRGLTKQRADVDRWLKEVAPSTELRKWFHSTGDFDEFTTRYRAELAANPALAELRTIISGHPVVTLLYSVHDTAHNHAEILRRTVAPEHG
jgi:uncharacterized protein YeaO (DUF488 family)